MRKLSLANFMLSVVCSLYLFHAVLKFLTDVLNNLEKPGFLTSLCGSKEKGQGGNGEPATNTVGCGYRSTKQVAYAVDAFVFPHADDLVAHD